MELRVISNEHAGIKKGQSVPFTLSNKLRLFVTEVIKINPMVNQKIVHYKFIAKSDTTISVSLFLDFVNTTIEKKVVKLKGSP
ncbi:MAG: hypothetical protein AB8G15_21520 [Saprospiraceae bacterium]